MKNSGSQVQVSFQISNLRVFSKPTCSGNIEKLHEKSTEAMQSISSLQYAAALSCGVFGVDTLLLLLTIKRQHLKEKLEKALAYEDSMAQSAKQTGLEVMRSSHISASERLFESRRWCKD